jgi:nitroreductase
MFDSSRPVDFGLIVEATKRAQEAAPSVCNRQGGRVYAMTTETGRKAALSLQNGNRGWGHEAGVVLILTASQEHYVLMREERYQGFIDGGMWSQAVLMGLHSVGLAACPLNFDVPAAVDMAMRAKVGIPKADTILMLVAVGHYPEEFVVASSPRKAIGDVLFAEPNFFPPAARDRAAKANRGG